jgi:hypothetical protein
MRNDTPHTYGRVHSVRVGPPARNRSRGIRAPSPDPTLGSGRDGAYSFVSREMLVPAARAPAAAAADAEDSDFDNMFGYRNTDHLAELTTTAVAGGAGSATLGASLGLSAGATASPVLAPGAGLRLSDDMDDFELV